MIERFPEVVREEGVQDRIDATENRIKDKSCYYRHCLTRLPYHVFSNLITYILNRKKIIHVINMKVSIS